MTDESHGRIKACPNTPNDLFPPHTQKSHATLKGVATRTMPGARAFINHGTLTRHRQLTAKGTPSDPLQLSLTAVTNARTHHASSIRHGHARSDRPAHHHERHKSLSLSQSLDPAQHSAVAFHISLHIAVLADASAQHQSYCGAAASRSADRYGRCSHEPANVPTSQSWPREEACGRAFHCLIANVRV